MVEPSIVTVQRQECDMSTGKRGSQSSPTAAVVRKMNKHMAHAISKFGHVDQQLKESVDICNPLMSRHSRMFEVEAVLRRQRV